jgi:hypothetical protein
MKGLSEKVRWLVILSAAKNLPRLSGDEFYRRRQESLPDDHDWLDAPAGKGYRRRQESFPDDLDWLDDPTGKDSCRRSQMAFSIVPKLWGAPT